MKKIGKGNLVLLALVLVMSLAFIWSKNYKEKTTQFDDNIILPQLMSHFEQGETAEKLAAQIAQGDYSNIQGKWTTEEGVNCQIDGIRLLLGKREYYMVKGGYDEYGIPYIMTDDKHSAKLYFYPIGKPIPTLQEDGTVVVSDMADPSDTSKNRLLFANSTPFRANKRKRFPSKKLSH
nr:hypothetical protein [Lactococcus garvieae]